MKNSFSKKIMVFLLVFSAFFSAFSGTEAEAAKDLVKPKIQIAVKKGKKDFKLKLTLSDNVGLKMIKHAEGKHRLSFFKEKHYSKKIGQVSLTSSKRISMEIPVAENVPYSIYVEDTAGNVRFRRVTVKTKMKPKKDRTEKDASEGGNGGKGSVSEESPKQPEPAPNPEPTPEPEPTPNPNPSEEENPKKDLLNTDEVRAAWITFLEFSRKGYNEIGFRTRVQTMFDTIASHKLNTVYVHVRPFSDALYRSSYYPWSKYVSGKQGRDPGFDPLAIMVEAAHARGLKIHAYINPYRVDTIYEFPSAAANNPAKRWLNDTDETNDRNVLKYDKMYYYNPAKPEVISLITNGVKEIVENYAVDGVIFDDYFYPNLGKNYKTNFDAEEYDEYVEDAEEKGITPLGIVQWRRENINQMVRSVYKTVKAAGKGQEFGISPAGNLNNLRSNLAYYVDIDRWGREQGFVDYLAPQLYWGFESKAVPFESNVLKWMAVTSNPNVKLYVALPIYKAQAQDTEEWKNRGDVLARMLMSLRNKNLKGFSIYRYDFMTEAFLTRKGALQEKINLFNLIR